MQESRVITGDVLHGLAQLEDESVHTCVTSPPYWRLRDYEVEGQLGNEPTPEEYTANMVKVFSEVRRVLRKDGTLWINLGDGYSSGGRGGGGGFMDDRKKGAWKKKSTVSGWCTTPGLKRKELVGIPWRVAFALQADGWYLRQEIIWNKPNPMPESAKDRPTRAHEQIFLLAKSARYHYDHEAILEPVTGNAHSRGNGVNPKANNGVGWGYTDGDKRKPRCKQNPSFSKAISGGGVELRNKRSVWTVHTKGSTDPHFATYPEELIAPCILAGCPVGGTVLDPFCGRGTTGIVAVRRSRNFVGIELEPSWADLSRKNITEAAKQMPLKGLE